MKTAVAPLAHEVPPSALDDVVAELNDVFIEKGTPMFMRTVLALFSGGFATFALLYCVQPMMPVLSHEYGINAAQSSLILSVATAMLAIGLLVTGPISDAFGRKPVMVFALFSAAAFTVLSALMPTWEGVLITRALVGLSLSGLAAVAMTYLSEEIHPQHIGLAMGLYIGGNAIGGMSGRLISGVLIDFVSWHTAMLMLERGEDVQTPPAMWIQASNDEVHNYLDPDSPFKGTELERFAFNYRKAGGKFQAEIIDAPPMFTTAHPTLPASIAAVDRLVEFVRSNIPDPRG